MMSQRSHGNSRAWIRALLGSLVVGSIAAQAGSKDGIDSPTLTPRVDQADVAAADSFDKIQCVRREGLRVFGNPNTLADGFGDGPGDPTQSRLILGNRVTFPNTPFGRLFGLDSQSCGECHSILSAKSIPSKFAIGGTNTLSQPVLVLTGPVDTSDADGNGKLDFNGRLINAPALWGAGGLELLAKEMTQDLQRLRRQAIAKPGVAVRLVTQAGVDFGSIVCAANAVCDNTQLRGIRPDLVVRQFGRRGDNPTIRDISNLAASFQIGMQPAEVVGDGIDADGDGVVNELTVGEISAITLWQAGLEPPRQTRLSREARRGEELFGTLGCAACHIPELNTRSSKLTLSFPEVFTDPAANVFQTLDLRRLGFKDADDGPRSKSNGIRLRAFADFKLHQMGPTLTDQPASDPAQGLFVTIALWGVADSAPYLHDGRALTINSAILMHDGEGRASRNAYAAASVDSRKAVLAFLDTLRAPEDPNKDILNLSDSACR
jgi:hypothetical protein